MRNIFISFLLLFSQAVFAQKTVAVWEAKCNGGGITPFKSGLVRAGLEEAVDNTPGYIKYDRAMFDAILKEHKFQRSGSVKDEDIRRMGEMAGVQYVIVPEVSIEENYFYIVGRIIDVETGQSRTAKELCESTAPEIDKACAKLAARLFNNQNNGHGSFGEDGHLSDGHERDYTETAFGINMRMIYVEGGTFNMGCTGEQGDDCADDEKNVRKVTLDSYYIGMLEITQSQYCKVLGMTENDLLDEFWGERWEGVKAESIHFIMGDSNYKEETEWAVSNGYYNMGDTIMAPAWGGGRITRFGDNYPIYAVGHYGATEFCRLLSEKTGKKYTLPTEAQWEYAARGGNKSRRTKYAGSNNIDEVAWYSNNSEKDVQACGTRWPNELGIYDMCGNVSEWCSDCYVDQYLNYDVINPGAATEEPECSRVIRGGNFKDKAKNCRVSTRSACWENVYYPYNVGFRVICIP